MAIIDQSMVNLNDIIKLHNLENPCLVQNVDISLISTEL